MLEQNLNEELDESQFVLIQDVQGELNKLFPPKLAGLTKHDLLRIAELCCAAYSTDDSITEIQESCQGHLATGYSLLPFRDDDSKHAGNIYFKGNEIVVAYRGTWNLSDVSTDLNALLSIPPFLNNIGRVHKGFYDQFCESEKFILDHIKLYCAQRNIAAYDLKVVVTGHSMGGALATIFALKFALENPQALIKVVTFGCPRVFDFPAADYYNRKIGNDTVRIVQHHIDPVPTMTTGTLGYKHVGLWQLRLELAAGFYPHQILGHIKAIENLTHDEFITNNSASVLWPMTYFSGWMNAYVIGVPQQMIVNILYNRSLDSSAQNNER
jgi:hypothetical protein